MPGGSRGGKGGGGSKPVLSEDDLEAIAEAVNDKMEPKLEEIRDSISRCVIKEHFERVKCAVRVNRYAADKNEQYARRETCRIHGFVVKGSNLDAELVDMMNHIARLDVKCKEIESHSDKILRVNKRTNSTVPKVVAETNEDKVPISSLVNSEGFIDPSSLPFLEKDLDTSYTPFSLDDISVCHPVKAKKSPQHMVRFVSRRKISVLYDIKKRFALSAKYSGVFITEDLTPLRFKLLNELKDNREISKIFTRNGDIHCTYKGKKLMVTSPDDLFKVDMEVDFEKLGLATYQ